MSVEIFHDLSSANRQLLGTCCSKNYFQFLKRTHQKNSVLLGLSICEWFDRLRNISAFMDIWVTKLWKIHSRGLFVEQRLSRFLGVKPQGLGRLKAIFPCLQNNITQLSYTNLDPGVSHHPAMGKTRDPGDEPVFTQHTLITLRARETSFTCHVRQNLLAKFGKNLS